MTNLPKFRAWNIYEKKMRRVSKMKWDFTGYYEDSFCMYNSDGSQTCQFASYKNIILMRSTGLKDKNGVEIFEGDIIEYSVYKCIVRFGNQNKENSSFIPNLEIFYPQYLLNEFSDKEYKVCNYLGTHSVIIGNIHENPELLKGAQA